MLDSVQFDFDITAPPVPPVVPQAGDMNLTSSTSISFDGVTFNFDQPQLVGTGLFGFPFVLSDIDVRISSVTPAGAGGANGLMVNPNAERDGYAQGFDPFLAAQVGNSSSSSVPHNSALDKDPAATGTTLVIPAGTNASVVKSVRAAGASSGNWITFAKFVPLSVVSSIPKENSLPLECAGDIKRPLRFAEEISLTSYRSLPAPAGLGSYTNALASINMFIPFFGWSGEKERRFLFGDISSTNYASAIAEERHKAHAYLHCDIPTADKTVLAGWHAIHATQLEGLYDTGYRDGSGAGQRWTKHTFLVFGGAVLQDAPLIRKSFDYKSNWFDQAYWNTTELVGLSSEYPSNSNFRYQQTIKPGHVGTPGWAREGGNPYASSDTLLTARYRSVSAPQAIVPSVSALILQNLPDGLTGLSVVLAEGPFNVMNNRAAAIAMVDTDILVPWDEVATTGMSQAAYDVYDEWRELSSLAIWTERPPQIVFRENGGMVAGNGSVSYDKSAWATSSRLALTDVIFRYGLDEVQYIEQTGVSLSDTITGLAPGVDHWCGIAMENSKGRADFSPNFKYERDRTIDGTLKVFPLRNVITTTGTAANSAPVARHSPKIMYDQFEDWGGRDYAEVPANFDRSLTRVLTLGLGYWDAWPALNAATDFTFSWVYNGTEISTNRELNLSELSDAGGTLQGFVIPTNSEGSASASTQVVTIPPLAPLASGDVVNTYFGADFEDRHRDDVALIDDNAAVALNRFAYFRTFPEGVRGAWVIEHDGQDPSSAIPFDVTPGVEYNFDIEIVTNVRKSGTDNGPSFGDVQVRLGPAREDFSYGIMLGVPSYSGSVPNAALNDPDFTSMDPDLNTAQSFVSGAGSFTPGPGETKVYVTMRMDKNSAGTQGSFMTMQYLWIREAT